MLTERLQQIAYRNLHFSAIPEITRKLMDQIAALLIQELNVEMLWSGSFHSKTCVTEYSDIDMLALFDLGSVEANQAHFKDFVLAIDGLLKRFFNKLDVDVYLSPPAECISHLSAPNYQIEITPAVSTSAYGLFLGAAEENDYLILSEDFSSIIATNPITQSQVNDYLNRITEYRFSYITGLLKLWKYKNNIPVISFALEVFMYHWLRGTCAEGDYPFAETINGIINLSFSCRGIAPCLEENILNVLSELRARLIEAQEKKQLYSLPNPYVRIKIPQEVFQLFESLKKQEEGLHKISASISALESAINAEKRGNTAECMKYIKIFFCLGENDDFF